MIICPVRSVVDEVTEVIYAGYWREKYVSKTFIGLNDAQKASVVAETADQSVT
jgi:hypothetical protein